MSGVVVLRDLNRRMCLGLAGHDGVWQLGPSLSSWAQPLAAIAKTSRWRNRLLRRSLRYFHHNAKMKQTRGFAKHQSLWFTLGSVSTQTAAVVFF
ncbi:uncharacterized [Tachysurus ichikawai]